MTRAKRFARLRAALTAGAFAAILLASGAYWHDWVRSAWAAGLFFNLPYIGGTPPTGVVAPTGPNAPAVITGTLPVTGAEVAAFDTNLPSGANPATELISTTILYQGGITSLGGAVSFTATAAQVFNGAKTTLVLTGAPAVAVTLTLPSAAAIAAVLPIQVSAAPTGYSYVLKFVNNGGTASGVWTIAAGTGDTITGNATVAVAGSRCYQVTFTSATAATFLDIGNSC